MLAEYCARSGGFMLAEYFARLGSCMLAEYFARSGGIMLAEYFFFWIGGLYASRVLSDWGALC